MRLGKEGKQRRHDQSEQLSAPARLARLGLKAQRSEVRGATRTGQAFVVAAGGHDTSDHG